MAKRTKIKDYDQFIVRLPPGLRDRLKELADSNDRSMNAEVVARLEESIKGDPLTKEIVLSQESAIRNIAAMVEKLQVDLARITTYTSLLKESVKADE